MKRKHEERTFYSLLLGERRTKQDRMKSDNRGILSGSAIQLWEWLNFNRAQLNWTRRVVFLVV